MPHISQTKDFQFEVPEDWTDRTMIAFSAPQRPEQAAAPNVLIAYDAPREGERLKEFAGRQLDELMKKAKDFYLELRQETELCGRPAVEVVFEWGTLNTRLKQRQIHSFLPDGRAITIVYTAAAEDFEWAEPYFALMRDSFRWNETEAVEA